MGNALAQAVTVSSQNYIDALKYVGAALAAVTAVTQAVLQAVTYLSGRNAKIYQYDDLRLFQVNQPEPWRNFKEYPENWASESYRRAYFRIFRTIFGISALFFAVIFFALIITELRSSSKSLSSWILGYAGAAFYGILSILFIKWSNSYGGKKYEQWSSEKRETVFVVVGSKGDVLQHCSIALKAMGASIVKFDEAQGTIVASRGLWIRALLAGQRILVSVSYDKRQTGYVRVVMSSDNFNPTFLLGLFSSPHARNVERFVSQWFFSKAQVAD